MVVDYGAVVAGSKARCPLQVGVAGRGRAAAAVSWADRRGLQAAWHRPNPRHARRSALASPPTKKGTGMVLLGADPHKDAHTVVAVDQAGRQLDQATVAARAQGHTELLGWATRRWAGDRLWAVEDCRHARRPAGTRPAHPPASGSCGSRPGWWPEPAQPCGPWASPTRPTHLAVARAAPGRTRPAHRRPRPGVVGGQAAGRPPRAPRSPSGPGRSTGCAGTCTSSTPTWNTPPGACLAHPWTRSPPGWPAPPRRSRSPSASSWPPRPQR
jgi:hypothetical protein